MRASSSVRLRIAAGAGTVLMLAMVVVVLTAGTLLQRALIADEDAVLADRVHEVEALLSGGVTPAAAVAAATATGELTVRDDAGALLAATPGDAGHIRFDAVDLPALGATEVRTVSGERLGLDGGDYRILGHTDRYAAGTLTIDAFSSLRASQRAEARLRNVLLLSLPVLALAAGGFLLVVVGRALAPVEQLRGDVEQIQATDLTRRVTGRAHGDEIARLGDTLNRMLDRLADAAARQALFAASASHELRSPLSAIRTELEVGLAYPDRADWPRVAEDCMVELERLERLARDLRLLTRHRGARRSTDRFALADVVAAELDRRRGAHEVHLVCPTGPPIDIEADRDAVLQVLRNLLDNGDRHARSRVELRVEPVDGGVALVVANDGEPIPIAAREHIFNPFTRLDEARSLDAGGSGLGLAIARTLTEADGGTLHALGMVEGAAFRAWWPIAPQHRERAQASETGTVRGPRT